MDTGGQLEQVDALRSKDSFRACASRQLEENPLEMRFDRFRGDPELAGYLFVGSSRTYKRDDNSFSISQLVPVASYYVLFVGPASVQIQMEISGRPI